MPIANSNSLRTLLQLYFFNYLNANLNYGITMTSL